MVELRLGQEFRDAGDLDKQADLPLGLLLSCQYYKVRGKIKGKVHPICGLRWCSSSGEEGMVAGEAVMAGACAINLFTWCRPEQKPVEPSRPASSDQSASYTHTHKGLLKHLQQLGTKHSHTQACGARCTLKPRYHHTPRGEEKTHLCAQ